jgi:hypothetical protein
MQDYAFREKRAERIQRGPGFRGIPPIDGERRLESLAAADKVGNLAAIQDALIRSRTPEITRFAAMALFKRREGADEERNACIGEVLGECGFETADFLVRKAAAERHWDVLALAAERLGGSLKERALGRFDTVGDGDLDDALRKRNLYLLLALHAHSRPHIRARLLSKANRMACENGGGASHVAAEFLGQVKEYGSLYLAATGESKFASAKAKSVIGRASGEDVAGAARMRDADALKGISAYAKSRAVREAAGAALESLGKGPE